jgi:hypothetical protein
MIHTIRRLGSPLGSFCVGIVVHLGVIVRWTRLSVSKSWYFVIIRYMEKYNLPEKHSLDSMEGVEETTLYSPEKIKPFNGVSDQKLEYYTNNNIWSEDMIIWMTKYLNGTDEEIDSLLEQKEGELLRIGKLKQTYSTGSHPLFQKVDTVDDSREFITTYINQLHVEGVKRYLDERGDPNSEMSKKIFDSGVGPDGHGSAMFSATGRDINFDVINKNMFVQSPTCLFLKYPSYFIGSGGTRYLGSKIDKGELKFPEFEVVWTKSVENYIKILPRLVTLLARDPKWDIRDMDKYIMSKNIENLDKTVKILGNDDDIGSMQDTMLAVKDRDYTTEERSEIVEFIKTWSEVYDAMVEYLENKVKYDS